LEPVLITTTDHPDSETVDTVHVFSIDGDEYHMPADPPANVGLQFVDVLGTRGEAAATAWLLREMLGDGYDALLDCADIDSGQLRTITNGVVDRALAVLEEDGQGNRAARRAGRRNGGRGSRATSTTSTPTSAASTASRSRKRSTS
jgi:hypothetical protein